MSVTRLLGIRPDKAWTGRPALEGASPNTDPLIADTLHNAKYSPLCRLPEELHLAIMKELDEFGVQSLRRTCRLFLRLFGDRQFAYFHRLESLVRFCRMPFNEAPPAFCPWNQSPFCLPDWSRGQDLGRLLNRDAFASTCTTCQANRDAREERRPRTSAKLGRLARAYCEACGSLHPPAYLSRDRDCIGRLGNVRLCAHEGCTITWDKAIYHSRRLRKLKRSGPARMRLLICTSDGHVPTHHQGYEVVHGDEGGCYPSMTMIRNDEGPSLCMEWTGHLQLGPETTGERVTPDDMARLIKRFRRGTPAEYIVPQPAPGRLPEMRCFDPNRCRCLLYAGREYVPGGWLLAENMNQEGGSRDQECRFSSPPGSHGLMTGMAVPGTHTARSVLGRCGASETRIDIDPCSAVSAAKGTPSCLAITYRRSIQLPHHHQDLRLIREDWFNALDPLSCLGVMARQDCLACPEDDPDCANYHRYSERPILRY
ncbi:hypothetical protein QBC34DRAFT_440111 [Podospora aff. communis PSN243]|uniref:F-box domain-containing protein n=1 Tax=Podospora aff. communis PSN243 TaxID=3040156 RepID=A0AAV9GHF0_9PEZI|nr:hypothetical protein QBC34DRAFT_440111 [Podospora aff. communis PSN243]